MASKLKRELKSNQWSCSDLTKASKKLREVKTEPPDMETDMKDDALDQEIKARNAHKHIP